MTHSISILCVIRSATALSITAAVNIRLDTRTTAEFQTRLLELVTAGPVDVIVDFAEVDYISSAGLRSLMAAVKAKPRDRRIAVATLNALIQEIYTIARFQHVIPAFDSVEAAIAAWTAASEPSVKAEAVASNTPRIGVRFWGTRGSLPVALNHSGVRAKIRAALLAVRERDLALRPPSARAGPSSWPDRTRADAASGAALPRRAGSLR